MPGFAESVHWIGSNTELLEDPPILIKTARLPLARPEGTLAFT